MELLSIILSFAWHLLSGEAYGLWKEHKANVTVEAIANKPVTDNEWTENAKNGDL